MDGKEQVKMLHEELARCGAAPSGSWGSLPPRPSPRPRGEPGGEELEPLTTAEAESKVGELRLGDQNLGEVSGLKFSGLQFTKLRAYGTAELRRLRRLLGMLGG